jgi:hypothetical protein
MPAIILPHCDKLFDIFFLQNCIIMVVVKWIKCKDSITTVVFMGHQYFHEQCTKLLKTNVIYSPMCM